jgi:hypothetical protein
MGMEQLSQEMFTGCPFDGGSRTVASAAELGYSIGGIDLLINFLRQLADLLRGQIDSTNLSGRGRGGSPERLRHRPASGEQRPDAPSVVRARDPVGAGPPSVGQPGQARHHRQGVCARGGAGVPCRGDQPVAGAGAGRVGTPRGLQRVYGVDAGPEGGGVGDGIPVGLQVCGDLVGAGNPLRAGELVDGREHDRASLDGASRGL